MRCQHCGWPNRPEETTCTKCGEPLEETKSAADNPNSTIANRTVCEDDIFGRAAQPNICAKCGYPLRPGLNKCPNCNSATAERTAYQESQPPVQPNPVQPQNNPLNSTRRPTVIGSPAPNLQGTVNVWTDGVIGLPPSFMLSPVQRNGERKKPEDIEYEGESVALNRDNTDPGNMSITSRTQAVISRKDDKWFIEDMSDQKTTFVRVSSPMELHDGDTILLGNRLFIFHE